MPPNKEASEQHMDKQISKRQFVENHNTSTITEAQIDEAVKAYENKQIQGDHQRQYRERTRLGTNDKWMTVSAKTSWQYWGNVLRNHKPRFTRELEKIVRLLMTKVHIGSVPTNTALYQTVKKKLLTVAQVRENCDNEFNPEKCAGLVRPTSTELEALRIYGDSKEGFGTFPTPILELLERTDLTWVLQLEGEQEPESGFWHDYLQYNARSIRTGKRPLTAGEDSLPKRAKISGTEIPDTEKLDQVTTQASSREAPRETRSSIEETLREMRFANKVALQEMRSANEETLREMRFAIEAALQEMRSANEKTLREIRSSIEELFQNIQSSNEDASKRSMESFKKEIVSLITSVHRPVQNQTKHTKPSSTNKSTSKSKSKKNNDDDDDVPNITMKLATS
ncbi:hypothetical protein F4811DRAFT_550010 [Daldinia bambusicola]|nr:hypothetical protein F4811DRAFT_550010 [Daldinia bambusicola]